MGAHRPHTVYIIIEGRADTHTHADQMRIWKHSLIVPVMVEVIHYSEYHYIQKIDKNCSLSN